MLLKDLVILYHFQRIFFGMNGILEFKYSVTGAFSICGADMVPSEDIVETRCDCRGDTG